MKILIVRVSAIGDVIHTLPALFLIKRCYPNAHISWIVQEKAASLLVSQPFLDNVWVLPDHFLSPSNWRTTYKTIKTVRAHKWDIIIDFQGLFKTACIHFWLQGQTFGFDRHHTRDHLSALFTRHHTTPLYRNIIQKNLALASDVLATCGSHTECPTIQELKKDFFLETPPAKQNLVDRWLHDRNITSYVLLFPNTTWPSKHWPLHRWQELIKLITSHYNPHSFILGGSTLGKQAADLAYIIQSQGLPIHILPPFDLISIAHLIKKSALVIAPDTGVLHLTDFLGIPSLGIFGPTTVEKHGPFLSHRNQQNAIQVTCPHIARKQHAHKKHGSVLYDCMEQLDAATVNNALRKILGLKGSL
ncbi:MAG: lipopolysaccharide heptosyltransferase I [Candidatus Babeliales bacterium]|jgi:lipopolysaccharide heptosyltransferase I